MLCALNPMLLLQLPLSFSSRSFRNSFLQWPLCGGKETLACWSVRCPSTTKSGIFSFGPGSLCCLFLAMPHASVNGNWSTPGEEVLEHLYLQTWNGLVGTHPQQMQWHPVGCFCCLLLTHHLDSGMFYCWDIGFIIYIGMYRSQNPKEVGCDHES